jgi:hypothetical protein
LNCFLCQLFFCNDLLRTSCSVISCGSFHIVAIDKMETSRVQVCVYCSKLVSEASVPSTVQHWPFFKTLRISSRSCHFCLTLYGIFARRSQEAQARFEFPDLEMDDFPLTISSKFCENSADGIHSKTVEAALNLPNQFFYSFELTIASCALHCMSIPISRYLHSEY